MRYITVVLTLTLFIIKTGAQGKLNKLEAPTSPASRIIGIQPSTVLSPKSYQALETTLFSNFFSSTGDAIIPNDFALEFTPYWTKSHSLSLDEYLYPKSAFNQFVRNSSFSIASTQEFLLGDSTTSNGLAFGYRTAFYLGSKKDREKIKNYREKMLINDLIYVETRALGIRLSENIDSLSNEDILDEINKMVFKVVSKYYKEDPQKVKEITDKIIKETSQIPPLNKTNPNIFLEAFSEIVDKYLEAQVLFDQFAEYIKERQGFTIDIAYANLLNFPTNNFELSYVPCQSVWITPLYRFKDHWSVLKVLGVFRYEWYNTNYFKLYFPETKIYKNNFDYGLAISTIFQNFSLQFEMVGRYSSTEIPAGTDVEGNELYRKEDNSDFQYLIIFNYNLTDQIVISYNLGNRFEPIQNPTNTLVSTLSLNFGFGAPEKADINVTK